MKPMQPMDPMAFAQPPAGAVTDEEAFAAIVRPNNPIFEDVDDIPKLAGGMMEETGMVPYEGGGGGMGMGGMGQGDTLDEEAMMSAVIDSATAARDGSRAMQDKNVALNEQAMMENQAEEEI